MLFNSFQFLLFFPIVTIFFFVLPERFRWILLLFASCFFYMFFKPIYILILFFTIIIDYYAGIKIENASEKNRRFYLIISLIANIGVLAIFKYYNFLFDNINGFLTLFKVDFSFPLLKIFLPIGLSFHTFQAMSYTIEVYRGNQKAEKHFGIYALYVMFYPQLVAGPIERPQNIIHQFYEKHTLQISNLVIGLKRIIWGVFKKVVIADRLAIMVDQVYSDPNSYHGFSIVLTIIFFAIQIYCDFSGYSDIALGSARVMGFELMENFNFPFASKNITEFWRKWHVSLSSWFNDYLFTPLATNWRNAGKGGIVLALLLTFSISGLWHGAGWTFIVFGSLHGIAVIVELLSKKIRKKIAKVTPSVLYSNVSILLTFTYACLTWIFFRSKDMVQAKTIFTNLFSANGTNSFWSLGAVDIHGLPSSYLGLPFWQFLSSVLLIPTFFILERIFVFNGGEIINRLPKLMKWVSYYFLVIIILFFGVFETKQFIYFQF
jgi:alginate O-acetyltransferase complex protein AlgI